MSDIAFNAVALEILWTRLISIVDEASAAFVRSCFSTLARESNDFAVVLTDPQGRSLAQSAISIPSFIGTLPATVRHVLERFELREMRAGDVYITNDPWMGTGHIHDINIVLPIFRVGAVVGFAAIASHLPDIGGRIRNAGIPDIFEEGLQIPLMKLVDAGEPNETLLVMIRQNVRVPEQTLGDVWGAVAACRMLAERLVALLVETGADFEALGRELRRRSETAMRFAIAAIPEGTYRSSASYDGFEEPIGIECAIRIAEGAIHIDYTGSSAQVRRAVNVVPIYAFAYSAFALKALLSPDVPNNDGSFIPLTTYAPEGSILNPTYPAASGARGPVGHILPAAIYMALAPVLPKRVTAPGSGNCGLTLHGSRGGRAFAVSSFINGGQGASARRDGLCAISFPSNMGNTPIEVLESQAPIVVIRRCVRRDSGGIGAMRGGDGLVLEFEVRSAEGLGLSAIMTRRKSGPEGLFGASAGKPARLLLNGDPIDPARHWMLKDGDRVSIETAGGGGYGAPANEARP